MARGGREAALRSNGKLIIVNGKWWRQMERVFGWFIVSYFKLAWFALLRLGIGW